MDVRVLEMSGMLVKSAIGLGAVYFAMFAPTLPTAELKPVANLCGAAAKARWEGDAGLRAQWVAAGCVVKLAEVQKSANSPWGKLAPAPPAPAPPAPPAPAKAASGTLTEADLAVPWSGPARISRKTDKRG